MPPAPLDRSIYRDRAALAPRAGSALLALMISGLLVFMLLRLGSFVSGPSDRGGKPIVVDLLAASEKASKAPAARPRPATVQPVRPPIPPPIPLPPTAKLNMLILSPEEYAASDISRLTPRPDPAGPEAAGAGADGADASVGRGPNGERLYNAEWYREPTDAEMVTYLPSGAPEKAWAMIACRTIDRYRVEDCQELDESPPGSGLARALRLASWQFLVRPPRVGGKSMVGAWVRIRFDFTQEKKG